MRLDWSANGERFYETGVDHGVLYAPGQDGVAWRGLISVSEAPSGGGPKPFYLDGIKYVQVASAEEFEATITAYSAPPEFRPCEGNVSIQNGLIATQQPKKSFGFSYRTMLGSDAGPELAYKIHLVYNALAAPSQRSNNSLGQSPDPTTYSWAITTLPPSITGYKPTAHLVVDSRYADPEILSTLEDVLYGSDEAAPSLPDPDDVIAIFTP